MNERDELYMRRAIQIAQLARGYNETNPRVGAVIVYKNRIIGEGWHERYGEGHAEVNAIASVSEENKGLLSQATIYVTLEPCFHYGKTPPCVELILKHKIPRVVIACVDENSKVGGQSIAKLKEAKIEVIVGVLEKEAQYLARRFFTNIQNKRPHIVLKFAQSSDGYIGQKGKEIAISNTIAKRLVHHWRSEETAILVGTNTALVDNPKLDNRYYFGRSPLRLVLDRNLKIPKDYYLLDGKQKTWIFTAQKNTLELPNVRFFQIYFNGNVLEQLLEILQQEKIQSLLVEGGQALLQSFLDANLWDECRVLISNQKLYKGIKAPQLDESLLQQQIQIGNNRLKLYHNKKSPS